MQLLKQGYTLDHRYTIISDLGSGGFGQTYLAEDTKLPGKPKCVVKQLKPTSTDPYTLQVSRRLFDAEAEVLNTLGSHDQIPRLLAHFEEAQEFYLVQEFIAGHSLSLELQPGKKLSESYVVALLENILQPLAFVHQHKVIHRDIKPANLIRRKSDGKIALIDFGAVKQISTQIINTEGQPKLTVAIGTPGYMPSEQSQGNPRFSSDIYALGIIAIQALTGLTPNELQTDPETAEILWRNQVNVSPYLADVLDKMVRYDFRQRYPSAIEALQEISNSATTTPASPPTVFSLSQSTPLPPPPQENTSQKAHLTPLFFHLTTAHIGILFCSAIVGLIIYFLTTLLDQSPTLEEAKNPSVNSTQSYTEPFSTPSNSSLAPYPTPSATDEPDLSIGGITPKSSLSRSPSSLSIAPKVNEFDYQLSPEELVQDYYININNRDYRAAWGQQSLRLQSNKEINENGYVDYLNFWKTVKRVDIQEINVVEQSNNNATVDVKLTYIFNNDNKDNYYYWRYYLVWNSRKGQWLLDNRERLN